MDECIFCKIAAGTISSAQIFSSSSLYAFLDLNPCNKGHTLIIPRTHYADLLSIDPQIGKDLLDAMQRVARALVTVTGAEGFNVLQNNGRAAGQEVGHLHWHIIPRFANDGIQNWPQHKYDSQEEMERLATAIRVQVMH